MTNVTIDANNAHHNGKGLAKGGGEYAVKPRGETSSESLHRQNHGLAAVRLDDSIVDAAMAAAAGGHNAHFTYSDQTQADVEALAAEMAAVQGKNLVVVDSDTTVADLVGRPGKPGLVTKAHRGVLYLRNAADMPASILDALRQPLEAKVIRLSRGDVVETFDADIQLVIGSTRCPCGSSTDCTCTSNVRRRHLGRVPGWLLDRMDVQQDANDVGKQTSARTTEDAAEDAWRARAAAQVALVRTPWSTFAETPGAWLRSKDVRLAPTETSTIDRALGQGKITMRGYDRVLRVSWTLAGMAGRARPSREDVDRATQMRRVIW